jgi:hypothetical protein
MNKLNTYKNYSAQLANEQAGLTTMMKTMTSAQADQVKSKFDDIASKHLYLTNMLEGLKSDFLKEQPLFAKLHKEE